MRESIGGGWLFGIVIVFIFLFSGFLAYSISYTKAFNVKNEVINYIEHAEGYTKYKGKAKDVTLEKDENVLNDSVEGKVYNLIYNVGYDFEANAERICPEKKTKNVRGVCITKFCPNGKKGDAEHQISYVHYKVTTFITFGLPFLNLNFTIPITGETRTIAKDYSGYECIN